MKPLIDISNNISYYILLLFLVLIPFSIAGCNILFTVLLLIWLITFINRKNIPERPASYFPVPKYFRYFLFYILATLIATLFSIDRLHSLKDNKEIFIYLLIPLFMLILNTKKRRKMSLYAVLAAAVVSSLLGIGQAIIQGVSLDHRLQGATSHWMTYSGLLMFPFIFFFINLYFEKENKPRILTGILLLPLLTAILLSLTRSMWVGISVSLTAFVIYYIIAYMPRFIWFAVPGWAVLIAIVILVPGVKNRVTSIFDPDNPTNKDRIYMFQVAMNISKDHPVTGVGPNGIEKVYDRYKPAGADHSNTHLHNNFLQVLGERGIIGLLALVLAFGSVIVLLVKKIKATEGKEKMYPLAVLFVFTGFLVAGLFEYNFGDSEVKFQLFYFLTIPFLILKDNSENQ